MTRRSAGILLWRRTASGGIEVLLGHMGGPFWARQDVGAWSVPKGELDDAEPALAAAVREFTEELGLPLPLAVERLVGLGEVRQSGGKRVEVWAGEADLDPSAVLPGTFTLEWPPRSGRLAEFPEIDRVDWFGLGDAGERIVAGQRPFLDRLAEYLEAVEGG
jgi:predicted NUDIX family NTP pyrophosphohydrolase